MINRLDATLPREAVDTDGAVPNPGRVGKRERRASVAADALAEAQARTENVSPVERRRPRGASLAVSRSARARPRPTARPDLNAISAAELLPAARIGGWLFRHRGMLPVPILAVALLLPGDMTVVSWLVGLATLVIAEVLRMAGVAAAGSKTRRRSRNVGHLVTDGPFGWMRNPLYVGNGLAWIGFATITGVRWLVPAAVVAFAIEYSLIVSYEEGVLESLFGQTYLAYKRRTPRWVPRRPAPGPRPVGSGHDWGEAWRSEWSTFANIALVLSALAVKLVLSRH